MRSVFHILPWFLLLIAGYWLYQTQFSSTSITQQETHQVVLEKITTIGKLELIHYQLKDIVELEVKRSHPLDIRSNPKVVLIVSGEVVGCIDLTQIKPHHIQVQADSLFIKLPLPSLCYYKIDHSQSKIYDLQQSIFDDEKTLIDAAYQRAEQQLKQSALEARILEQTYESAEKILQPLLEKMTQKKVILIPETTLPPIQQQSFHK